MISPVLLLITIIIAFAAISFKAFIIVEKNEEAVIERFGNFSRVVGEGVHMIIPYFERIHGIDDPSNHKKYLNNGKISLEPAVIEFPNDFRDFFCKDKDGFKIRAMISYRITDPYKAVYEVDYLLDALNQLFAGIIQKKLVDLPEETDSFLFLQNFGEECKKIANEYSANWGVEILEFRLGQIIEKNGIRHNF